MGSAGWEDTVKPGLKYSPSREQGQGFWKWLKILPCSTVRWLKHNTCWRSPRNCFKRSTLRATVIFFFSLWIMLAPFHTINQSPWHSAEARQGVRQQRLRQRPRHGFDFPDRHIISTRHRSGRGTHLRAHRDKATWVTSTANVATAPQQPNASGYDVFLPLPAAVGHGHLKPAPFVLVSIVSWIV